MQEKINYMLGMTDNMLNMADSNMHMEMMPEIYGMTSTMMGNLHHMRMKYHMGMDSMIDMMEQMMRSMEEMMKGMNMDDMSQKIMMKNMMNYMVMMQMHMVMHM